MASLEDLGETFRCNLAHLLTSRQMGLAEVSRTSGIGEGQLSHLLVGQAMPTLDDIAQLAAALNVEPSSLLEPMS